MFWHLLDVDILLGIGDLDPGRVEGQLRLLHHAAEGRGLIAGVVLGQILDRFTDASLPFMDSLLTSFSIVAQWMQTRKLLETWLLWIVVDVFYVGMFVMKELYLTAGLYAVFLLLAAVGFAEWRRSMASPMTSRMASVN